MPRLSDSMEEGTVLKWLVAEGGEVRRGQPLVEIETDKANMTYEADSDGVLLEVLANEGDTLPIGEPIARVGEVGEAGGDVSAPAEEPATSDEPAAADGAGAPSGVKAPPQAPERGARAVPPPARPDGGSDGDGRTKASPVAGESPVSAALSSRGPRAAVRADGYSRPM